MIENIFIKGAKTHNLKNIDLEIPRGKFVVVTGVSGSGKSSLTIDTLYAEGQRRYVESLSSYARQFLSRMNKPDVEYIKGISPAIAIEQKVTTATTRSTVGTLTEIYDYLRLLYARIGITYSPISGEIVSKHEVADVIHYIETLASGTKLMIMTSIEVEHKPQTTLELLLQKGFMRVFLDGEIHKIDELIEHKMMHKKIDKQIDLVIDRMVYEPGEEILNRLADSIQTAFEEGRGNCFVHLIDTKKRTHFNNKFEADGMSFELPTPHFFNFNNSYGACKYCEGYGTVLDLDPDLIIPDKTLSVYEGCVAPWKGEKMSEYKDQLVRHAHLFEFPIHRPYEDLEPHFKDLLWNGNKHFEGINGFFRMVNDNLYKIQYRVLLSRYKGRTTCPECQGSRIRQDASYVKIDDKHIGELVQMPIDKLISFFDSLNLNEFQVKISERLLKEIRNRLHIMQEVGLGYLTLNRFSNTLSGGESQRINLTRSLGSNLTNSLYILDEPSIGLHPKDTNQLIKVLKKLRDLGNTVIVVEHEEEIMRSSDYLIDIGPAAGVHGGEVVYAGDFEGVYKAKKSDTALYLSGKKEIIKEGKPRRAVKFLEIIGASHHNLKNIDVKIPLEAMTVVTGVSGSGKTTLIKKILYPLLKRSLEQVGDKPGLHKDFKGDIKFIKEVELIDQNPLGRSSRSNPVTYVKAYDLIRDLYASQQLSKIKGFKPKDFSFNVEGGRCEACKGDGVQVVEMQFLADVELVCDACKGLRFKEEILEVKYKDKNIYDVLEMTIEDSLHFFKEKTPIVDRLKPLMDVGLGYIKLGQSSSTLSGGEAQRVKLASYLTKGSSHIPIMFIFDEPTTGLHFSDIQKLLYSFEQLINLGHSIVIIEHNMDVIKCADWMIDLGPEGGERGGELIYMGEPSGVLQSKKSYTGKYLADKFKA